MSAHTWIEINGRPIETCREAYIADLAALFVEGECRHNNDVFGYISTVGELRDRLQLQGFTAGRARADLGTAVQSWYGADLPPDALSRETATILSELSEHVNSTDQLMSYSEPEAIFTRLDSRTILRLALDAVTDSACPVRYNLDDLQTYRLLAPGTPITERARADRTSSFTRHSPLVILTEGSTDSQLLTEAIRVTHPHLVGFMRFMDFNAGAEGGVSSLIKLVKSFAGAGIANRVLALADNDTAAYDALSKIKREGLPGGYRIMHYPELPLLRWYPTLGPQLPMPVNMDVNGMAGSLEMYLGQDVLTVDGELVPVQWMGYNDGQKKYQGAISKAEKTRIHKEFRKKVTAALQSPSMREEQDWSGIEAIIGVILSAFDHPTTTPLGDGVQHE